ncbi:MAG: FUSC family protein [Neisseriaceae bacterium]|nr:MAG: FUSC family protein [Neisseriaceae bacterium]
MSTQSLKFQRVVHNALIFTISLFISFYSHIPFAFWVSATVLAIMLPLETSLIQDRIKSVFIGTIQGLTLFIPLWLLMDINSNLIFIIIPFTLAAMNFFLIHNFTRNIAFLNINLGIFLEYIQFGSYHFSYFLVARIMSIIIGVLLVWFGEILFTRRKNYGYYEFDSSINQLSITLNSIRDYFEQIKLGYKTSEHQLTVTQNLVQINSISDKIHNNYNSILLENDVKQIELLSKHYLPIPNLLKEYKLALLGIGYTISDDYHSISSTNFEQIRQQLNKISQILINHINILLQEKYL